ncbi:pyridoxal phosphate-dependent aminotransferase [Roseobacteraceae bacterium S113]
MIRATSRIATLAPYALASMETDGSEPPLSLSQNESFRPASPKAFEAAAAALEMSHLYPDPDWSALRRALAHHHAIPFDGILCAAGSLDLIATIAQVFAGPDRAVLAPAHAYPFFRSAAALSGARFDTAPETRAGVDISALLKAVTPQTSIVFVANPGNPTGTYLARDALVALRDGLPENVLLVIDEAYGEFADGRDAPMFDLVARGDTIVLRTFSKAYGLAGLRVGWGLFPQTLAGDMRKAMNPNNLSSASQAAACAALQDHTYMRATCTMTAELRNVATTRLITLGFDARESATNFVLIPFETPTAARRMDQLLRAQGIMLRAQGGAGLPHALRLTLCKEPDLTRALDVIETITRERTT